MKIDPYEKTITIPLELYSELKVKTIAYDGLKEIGSLPKTVIDTTEDGIKKFYDGLILMSYDVINDKLC